MRNMPRSVGQSGRSAKTTCAAYELPLCQVVPPGGVRYLNVGVEEEETDDHSFELVPLGARFPLLLFHQIYPGPGWG